MKNTGMARRLIELLKVIRPPLPAGADYTVEEKAALYDQARHVLYDERGQLRALDRKVLEAEDRGFPNNSDADPAPGVLHRHKSG